MNKKLLIVGALILALVALTIPAAFAADTDTPAKAWFEQRMASKRVQVDQAVQNGTLTPEQGQAWQQHFDKMSEFRAQNGYTCPGAGPGKCGLGPGAGMGRNGGGPWQNNPSAQIQ
ncbi:DUF2680 domain-containing protein [Desulfotomaculum sp. 1211_IL3151]|uniref:DUF2680 domain-containing protein n=1 Tax=Desulfotomaculum sp. 1211_IL3151 TaxID=3084055 RepID=UPI002FDAC428